LPPLLFAALRFTFVLLPAVFFLPPKLGWGNLALYGVAVGFGQFGLLFLAMDGMISPGLASLVVQMQVFFTIGISMTRSGERLAAHQIAALALALAGMGVIAAHGGRGTTVMGLALTLAAALSWANGNQAAREAAKANPGLNIMAYVVWSSLFALPPLYLLSPHLPPGRWCCGKASAIPCSAMAAGLICWRATPLPPSHPCRFWCRCSVSPLQLCCWANPCKAGRSPRRRW
jgi:O-acetylserine/cysteine efflux transporter